ncbi:MAG: metal-dependent transcriptional regulator [Gemmatimonadetes bacterium]|nr:metal-dependent transcriptional regulator [Gemmatimonadota bacterium]MDA1102746.1 metal-dependent transcriptional regulator [Gemmatimonadota bacterium]
MTSRALSRSVEDYLKAIYGLSNGGDPASTSAIAEHLDIQPASVTGMIKRLAESGLLEHVPYKGVRLTEPGTREALRVLRRHRIIETYLCERLAFAWEDVHEEAERLEHAASDKLIDQMAQALGYPSHDPHGAPIPTSAGDIELTDVATLAEAPEGARLRVRAVRDQDAAHLKSMAAEGLVPGARILVRPPVGRDGAVGISLADNASETRSVDADIARNIYVVPDES